MSCARTALRPGNAGGAKDPDFWCAFDDGEVKVIGDEPENTDNDPDPSEKAIPQGGGGACLPFLPALRQDLPCGYPASCLCAGPSKCGRAGYGRNDLCGGRSVGPGEVAGGPARGTGCEDVPARSGAAGVYTEAGRRRATARHSNDPGSGGPDRRQARAGTNLRGGLRG